MDMSRTGTIAIPGGLWQVITALLITSLLSGTAGSGDTPSPAQVRRLLEFKQDLLSEDEGWDYLLGSMDRSEGISRYMLLTRESRLPGTMLVELVSNRARSTRMRALGLRYLPPASLQRTWIEDSLRSEDNSLRREAVLSLQTSTAEWRDGLLRKIAADSREPIDLRAEAVLGLATRASQPLNTRLLLQLAVPGNRTLQIESLRALRGQAAQNGEIRNALLNQIDRSSSDDVNERAEIEEQLVQALAGVDDRNLKPLQIIRARVQRRRPATLADWQTQLRTGGDANAGRRVFFHPGTGHCARCHRAQGRGGAIASDLTIAGRAAGRDWLIESIAEPDRTIPGPYINWTLITDSGSVHSGLLLSEDSESVLIGTIDGRSIPIRRENIVSRHPQRKSLMPGNIVSQLTTEEFRNLIAFLCRN